MATSREERFTEFPRLLNSFEKVVTGPFQVGLVVSVLSEVPANDIDVVVVLQQPRVHGSEVGRAEHQIGVEQSPAFFLLLNQELWKMIHT